MSEIKIEWGHFSKKAMACRHCGKIGPLPENLAALLEALNKFRKLVNKPVIIHCAYRCPAWNADPQVGGVVNSYHTLALAADLHVEGMGLQVMAALAKKSGFRGVGLYPNWNPPGIHVDLGPIRTWIK